MIPPAAVQYCTFRIDGLLCGVEVREVREVIGRQPVTRVPLASPLVQGLINLRGLIVPAVDLRRRLGRPDRSPQADPVNVVVNTPDGQVSLLVDEIGDVTDVEAAWCETPPDTLRGPARDLIRSAVKLPGDILLLLDIRKAVTLPSTFSPRP